MAFKRIQRKYSGDSLFGEVMEGVLDIKDMGGNWLIHRIFHHCIARLGVDFMKHMEPVSLNVKGTLFCHVDNPVWVHQYTMRKRQILESISREPAPALIRDIVFKVGTINKSEYIFSEDPAVSFQNKLQQQQLEEEDLAFINEQLAECNPGLREDVRLFLESALKMQKLRGVDEHGRGE